MIDPDGLNVWSGQSLVGYLQRNHLGQLSFNYDDEWLVAQERFALSVTLPLQEEEFSPEDGLAHRFFANLLPEGNAREQVVRGLKISDSDFDLLRAIGGECAGALSVLRTEESPLKKPSYQELSAEQLANLIKRKGQPATRKSHDNPRHALAGAQDKCPIRLKNSSYWLPQKESPSSHILKFEVSGYRHLPAYEAFTNHLAGHIGHKVVETSLQYAGKESFALITRYDRTENKQGEILRLHQEDFCQALGYGHQQKYQEDGGPSFADCYQLLKQASSNPAEDLDRLLRWQIFNVLAGNSDGHAKNLALLYLPGGEVMLAPFYDLICTRAIERIDDRLAFSVGGERNPSLISHSHWDTLAKDCGVNAQNLKEMVKETADMLLSSLAVVRENFKQLFGEYRALERIQKVVTTQCKRALKK